MIITLLDHAIFFLGGSTFSLSIATVSYYQDGCLVWQ